jgi:CRISPR-associated endonuclease/helicase Cas3
MDAYLELQGRIPAMRLTLFHARFAIGDRLEIERRVLHLFGKDGTAEQRCGQVLIATQVIEQSLDLDFDVMISDLAPIDSLIQRAGRLWRHVHRERVGSPVLHLISPDLAGSVDAAWYRRLFPRGAIVYPDHGALWLTADELARRGTLHLPMEARALIEAVYDEAAAERIPDALEPSRLKYEGGTLSAKIIAESALLPLSEGYTHAVDNFENDMLVPTRLGQPQSQLRLAKWQDGTLRPWAEGDDWIAWRLSELTILKVYVAQEVPAADTVLAGAIAKAHDSWPERDKDSVLIALAREGENTENWIGEALDRNGKPVALRYNDEFGLAVSR